MNDFTVRSENVDVEQIMGQIRARIREKRGVDYTEEEIRELANVRLEKFIDPKGVRSGLLDEYRRISTSEPPPPNFAFEDSTLFETHRGPIRWLRALFRPLLKLLFNPNPLIHALHIQAEVNTWNARRHERLDALHYEVIHNLVVEVTRTGLEVKSLKMRLESIASRLDFDERRARALEGVVQYRPGAVPPLQVPTGQDQGRRDQGRRDQGRDQGRQQGQRDQGQRPPQGPRPQGPPQQPSAQQAQPAAPAGSMPAPPMGEANALDADGNERRARRRRRRGRRRPGFGEGSASSGGDGAPRNGEGSPAGSAEPSAAGGSQPDMSFGASAPASQESGGRSAEPAPSGGDSGPSGS